MNVSQLAPAPEHKIEFAWSHHRFIPEQPGCYALTTFSGEVLYVGLAKVSIRSRIGDHLNTPEKRREWPKGTAFWCYYTIQEPSQVPIIERGWMNKGILEDGEKPPINKIYSPL